jgi:glutamine amidotransferase
VTLNRKYPDHPDGLENPWAYKDSEEHGSHVIVASEPTTYKKEQWNLIPKNHSLAVGKDGQVEVTPIEVPQQLMATARST